MDPETTSASETESPTPTDVVAERCWSPERSERTSTNPSGKLRGGGLQFKALLQQETTTTMTVERLGVSSLTFVFEVWGEKHERRPRRLAARGRVTVVHVPSGTQYRTNARTGGAYSLLNMRVGGPYRVTATMMTARTSGPRVEARLRAATSALCPASAACAFISRCFAARTA